MKKIIIVFLPIVFFSSSLFAASFDCKKASTKTEKWICSDKELGKLDENMAELYKDVKRIYPGVVSEQKEWLKSIKGCENAACLKGQYQERNSELVNIIIRAEREALQKE
jgi:uncharacterized protein